MMDQVEEVKSKVDIVEVISLYVPLKKAGRNFAGLCPFHGEKTPSFMVSTERQAFKCFGCGEAGDVFTFLEKVEGWDFREALEELAKRVGVKLKSFVPSDKSREREKLIAINTLVSKFYAHLLNKHPAGEKARVYLKKRGIGEKMWGKFGLGYAPAGWSNTFNFLTKRGFVGADVANSGLIIARPAVGTSFYDRFRDRLVFPLKDIRGTVLGFSARIIDDRDKSGVKNEPKYINSPETPIFNKGSLLFGMDVARGAIREKNEAILVEGEFDVISATQAGIENVVASKGTALTDKQVAQLSRICENVSLCFDTDLAGDTAQRRGIELLDLAGVNVRIVRLGEYKDPDEFCQKNPAGFKKAISAAINVYDYLIESASGRFDARTAEGKKKIGKEVIPILSKISDDLVRAHYIDKLSRLLDLDVSLVASAVEKKVENINTLEYGPEPDDTSKKPVIEEYFLALFLANDEIQKRILKFLLPDDFENDDCVSFWKWLRDIISVSKYTSCSKALAKLPKKLGKFVDNLYLANISPVFSDKELWADELAKIAVRIKQNSLKRQLVEITRRIKEAEREKNTKQVAVLTKRIDYLSKRFKEEVI